MRAIEFRFFDNYHRVMVNEGGSVKLDTSDIIDQARKQNYPLMQFTGLQDKNGVKLFEGDIVECSMSFDGGVLSHMGEIVFSNDYGAFATKNLAGETLLHNHCLHTIKILGNIHQTPELLGEK